MAHTAAPDKPRQRGKIAARARTLNTALLALFLVVLAAASAVTFTDINDDASKKLARAHALEAAEKFHAYLSQDLVLVRKASRSKALVNWFADEKNRAKKALAYDEMMDYAGMPQNAHLHFGIQATLNEYAIDSGTAPAAFVPFGQFDPSDADDAWYFACIDSADDYTLNVDINKFTHAWQLWIRHKVRADGKPVGVFASGLAIQPLLHEMFGQYDGKNLTGYVVDKHGVIRMDSSLSGYHARKDKSRIQTANPDPAFTSAIGSYLDRIDGVFGPQARPETVKLVKGPYGYASVAPIPASDWSVVIFCNPPLLSGVTEITNFAPLLVALLVAIFLYTAAGNALIRHLVFTPLHRLTQSVSDAKTDAAELFGKDRDDEIGELARTVREMRVHDAYTTGLLNTTLERQRQERLLRTVNSAAFALLATADEAHFEDSLLEGMELMGRCLDVDRVQIWQNETVDGVLHFVHRYQWLSDTGRQKTPVPIGLQFPYSDRLEWEGRVFRGEYINGPISALPQDDQAFLRAYDIQSIAIIPLFLQGRFWGFFSLDDCRRERAFTEDEIDILRSASLMMSSAVNRNTQAAGMHEAHTRARILLDAMPLVCHLWNNNFELFDCNAANATLFKLSDQRYILGHFSDFSPEYQPDGQLSSEKAVMCVKKAFEEGRYVFEWMHRLLDGTPIPAEITLVRVRYGDGYAVAAYLRDLREHKQMMKAIEQRDNLLNTVNRAAAILLQPETSAFESDVRRCMGMMAEAVDVDRVYVWKNNAVDGRLCCAQLFEWTKGAESQQRFARTAGTSYCADLPGWEEQLSNRRCINAIVRDLPPEMRECLSSQGILSLLVVPVFLQDHFWGFVGFDDCRHERRFTENEESILRSGSLLITNAILRNNNITEMIRLQAELEAALGEARNANHSKSIFLARMSHEMRTPLNAVIGLSELTMEMEALHEETRANLEKIHNAGMTLLLTVNDILDISKIEAGKFEIVPVEYDIPSLLNDTITQSILYIAEKPIQFILDIDENLPTRLYGDDLRIKQLMNNLLSNAFKYTKEGTVKLSMRCEREGEAVRMTVRVSDTGTGIRSEDLDKLFTDYTQMDMRSNRAIEGTGLGLPIVKRIAEMMDGSITVESAYGKGSVFTVRILQKFVTDAAIGAAVVQSLKNFRYSDHKRGQLSRLPCIRLPYARVLVVDDMTTNLDVAKGMMKPYEMRVDCVTSGQQAIDAIRAENVRYNAVFMDHMMPGMDGIEAVRIIREEIGTEYAKTVPIIALTANAIVGNEEMFLSRGFQAFVPKPIELVRLDAIIRQWVRDKTLEKPSADRLDAHTAQDDRNGGDRRAVPTRRSGIDRRTCDGEIAGLRMSKGIERFGGDEEAYLHVLRSYAANTPPLLETARGVTRENLANYAIIVHGIKSSSRSICADIVGAGAEALEKAAKAGDIDFVTSHNAAFIEAVEMLVSGLNDMLRQLSSKKPKPKKDKPDGEALSRLLTACENYDMDGVDAAMAEIEGSEYESDGGLAAWLRENVDQMNFTQIKEKLLSMVK